MRTLDKFTNDFDKDFHAVIVKSFIFEKTAVQVHRGIIWMPQNPLSDKNHQEHTYT